MPCARCCFTVPTRCERRFDLAPGDLVACVRGIEHTLLADHEVIYYQYFSLLTGSERGGHFVRDDRKRTDQHDRSDSYDLA